MSKSPKITIRTPAQFIASGFGSGCMPFAPGTFGTIAAIPLWYCLQFLPFYSYLGIVLIIFIFGTYFAHKASHELNVHDHGGIVIDEFVGYFITMSLIPTSWINVLIGFILFRIFDVIKPWPIRYFDKHVKGGFGIMIDDVIAGLIACLIFHLLLYFLPW